MEGSIIQLKISCNDADSELYCIAFRIAGVHGKIFIQYLIDSIVGGNRLSMNCLFIGLNLSHQSIF